MKLYVEQIGGGVDWLGTSLVAFVVLGIGAVLAIIPLSCQQEARQEAERQVCRDNGKQPVDYSHQTWTLVGKVMLPVTTVDSITCR